MRETLKTDRQAAVMDTGRDREKEHALPCPTLTPTLGKHQTQAGFSVTLPDL